MSPETIIAFLGAALVLAFVPGPDNVFVLTNSAIHGRRVGLTIVLGLCTGLLVHTAAVALGVAAIIQTSQVAFSILKYAGAAYLCYLAWQAFRSRAETIDAPSEPNLDGRRFYLRGIIMNVANPKVSIFFLTFLPQFVNQHEGRVTLQLLTFGGLFIVATLFAFGLIATFSASVGARLTKSLKAQQIMNRVAGVVYLALAARLATSEQ